MQFTPYTRICVAFGRKADEKCHRLFEVKRWSSCTLWKRNKVNSVCCRKRGWFSWELNPLFRWNCQKWRLPQRNELEAFSGVVVPKGSPERSWQISNSYWLCSSSLKTDRRVKKAKHLLEKSIHTKLADRKKCKFWQESWHHSLVVTKGKPRSSSKRVRTWEDYEKVLWGKQQNSYCVMPTSCSFRAKCNRADLGFM